MRGAIVFCMVAALAGCSASAPKPVVTVQTTSSIYPARPSVAPPTIKIFHQDNDTYTLVTKPDAKDDEIAAILWEFHDAAKAHSFDTLHLSQAFIDARKPSVWFHVYRGAKCAGEKYTKGALPCDASYHGAGDFTLGAYNNPGWNMGELHQANGKVEQLWDADKP